MYSVLWSDIAKTVVEDVRRLESLTVDYLRSLDDIYTFTIALSFIVLSLGRFFQTSVVLTPTHIATRRTGRSIKTSDLSNSSL